MKKLLIGILTLTTMSANAYCPKPALNSSKAFEIIQQPNSGRVLKNFLENNVVSKYALNESCETMYLAAIRLRNKTARRALDEIKYGPNTVTEVNSVPSKKLNLSYFEYSLALGSIEAIEDLRARGGKVDTAQGHSTEFLLVILNSKEVVEAYIKAGADVNANDKYETALTYAVKYNSKEVVELLIRAGAHINASVYEGETALIASVTRIYTFGNADFKDTDIEMIKTLVKSGADIQMTNENGETALDIAVKNRYPKEVLDLLRF